MLEFLLGLFYLNVYFMICGGIAIILRLKTNIADEPFRKLLHCIVLGSMAVWITVIPEWWQAALSALAYAVMGYTASIQTGSNTAYSTFMTERTPGEIKSSMFLVFCMFAGVVTVCWGLFHDKYLLLASVYAWGIGDAGAALVGTRWGKHKITGKFLTGKKSWEGTAAMFVCALVSVLVILLARGGLSIVHCAVISLIVAAVSAAAELYSRNGYDTIICPLCAMSVLLPLTYLFGGIS